MLTSTTETLPGHTITTVLGIAKGSTVQTRHIGSHIVAALTTLVGGEVKGYVKAVAAARDEATERMLTEAESMGADAVVCVRYATSQIMNGSAEVLVYGTAVTLAK